MTKPLKPLTKPAFRGCFHQEAFFISLGACALLIAKAGDARTVAAASIYTFSLLFLFASSAIYHRFHWSPKQRQMLQRVDHSAIFVVIAGTATPLALLCLPPDQGQTLLWLIWGVALLGIIQSIFWIHAPKWVMASECIAMGWLSFPFLGALKGSLSSGQFGMLIAGGVVYSLGAIFYATKRPQLWPAHFGYHELFHLCTVIGAAFHFAVIHGVVA
jgi:hemolysin III